MREMMTKIPSGLPPKYVNLKQAWLPLDEKKQTLYNLATQLLNEEANLSQLETRRLQRRRPSIKRQAKDYLL